MTDVQIHLTNMHWFQKLKLIYCVIRGLPFVICAVNVTGPLK